MAHLETNINDLQPWAEAYIERLSPRGRQQLLKQLGRTLRKENSKRITAQKNPDGSAWEKRKPQKPDESRPKKMFRKMRQVKRLREKATSQRIEVGFVGRSAEIARIHHYGLRQRLQYGVADYSARELLGISTDDQQILQQQLMMHIGGGE